MQVGAVRAGVVGANGVVKARGNVSLYSEGVISDDGKSSTLVFAGKLKVVAVGPISLGTDISSLDAVTKGDGAIKIEEKGSHDFAREQRRDRHVVVFLGG